MADYVATFHTHLSAMLTYRSLTKAGITAKMAPVPRKLSSSCGTCIFFESESDCRELIDEDMENLYVLAGESGYKKVI